MRTVLVVDDEFGIADALTELLAEEGFRVLTARNGKDGMKRAIEERPALVLLDYMMPVMDGRELLHAMRADPVLQSVPVVMMSAMPRASLPKDCVPDAFLRKPFELDALLTEVHRLVALPDAVQ